MMTLTLQHQGQEPGRARRLVGVPTVVEHGRRGRTATASLVFHTCAATGAAAFPADAYGANDTTTAITTAAAGAMWLTTSIKRPSRHLGTRST